MGDDRAGHEAALAAAWARTEARLAALARDFDTIVAAAALSPPDDEHDPEGATTAFERQQLAALIVAAEAQLVDLDRASGRLHTGTYGTCSICGRPITPARLEARPAATSCVRCARPGPSRPARSSSKPFAPDGPRRGCRRRGVDGAAGAAGGPPLAPGCRRTRS